MVQLVIVISLEELKSVLFCDVLGYLCLRPLVISLSSLLCDVAAATSPRLFFYNVFKSLEMDAGWKSYNGQELISDWQEQSSPYYGSSLKAMVQYS